MAEGVAELPLHDRGPEVVADFDEHHRTVLKLVDSLADSTLRPT
ncbi:hypothetical protein [Nocardia sp. SYP-A9097]|nr:hypothetical protein [Nocardia sp. SYP-A9097]